MVYTGIDYGNGMTNVNLKTGIRFGVISQNEVLQAWCDSSKPYYGEKTETETEENEDNFCDPISYILNDGEYVAECDSYGDIFITKSPYYTYAGFCSPCAPGACYLTSPLTEKIDNNKCYCFGSDWFEEKAPYTIFSVETNEIVG